MTVDRMPTTPQGAVIGSRPDEWVVLEAELVAAQVDELLDAASSQLARMTTDLALPVDVSATVIEAVRLAEASRLALEDAAKRMRA